VAAAVYAAAFGYVALLWTLVGITALAAVLAYRAEHTAGSYEWSQPESSSSAPSCT
jgi:hypothetical protein